MKKIIIQLFIIGTFLMSLGIMAAGDQRVYDLAELYSSEEISTLESQIAEARQTLPIDLVIVTTADAEGKTAETYADNFYDDNGFGVGADEAGILMLIDMDNRMVQISTKGVAIDYFTDSRISELTAGIAPFLTDEHYVDAATLFINEVKRYVAQGIPEGQYRTEVKELGFKRSFERTPMYLFIALLIAGITIGVMVYNNKGNVTTDQSTYLDRGSMRILNSFDNHINTSVTKQHIESSSSGKNGSSTHSGGSHGGGGRSF